jgi:hypothetical protein
MNSAWFQERIYRMLPDNGLVIRKWGTQLRHFDIIKYNITVNATFTAMNMCYRVRKILYLSLQNIIQNTHIKVEFKVKIKPNVLLLINGLFLFMNVTIAAVRTLVLWSFYVLEFEIFRRRTYLEKVSFVVRLRLNLATRSNATNGIYVYFGVIVHLTTVSMATIFIHS